MEGETADQKGLPELAGWIFPFLRRVLLVGCGSGAFARQLKAEGREVHSVERDPELARQARGWLDSVIDGDMLSADLPFPEGYLDGVIFAALEHPAERLQPALAKLAPVLSTYGAVYLVMPNRMHPVNNGANGLTLDETEHALGAAAFARYRLAIYPQPPSPDDPAAACPEKLLVMAVRDTYDPAAHARALFKAGRPAWSLALLENIPSQLLEQDMALQARVGIEKQLCYLAWSKTADPEGRLRQFFLAQKEFYKAVYIYPYLHEAYCFHARFWHEIGNDDMAARLLRSIQWVAPNDACRQQLRLYATKPRLRPAEADPPIWERPSRPTRLLIIIFSEFDPGTDVLYNGLCTVLGDESVIEYPWKPMLHGLTPERSSNYPCTFEHHGEPWDLARVIEALREGYFDAVLFADMLKHLDGETIRGLMAAASDIPLFIVDLWDDGSDNRYLILEYLGRDDARAYFKREMLTCYDYGPHAYPLPLSYADGRIPEDVSGERPEPVFWAGQRLFGLRRLYLERIEELLGTKLDATYAPEEYARQLLRSRIGLSLLGFGFDTVRYLEVPTHGALLLAERPPIRIPHNFRDGESAVFFDDLHELEEKLAYYIAHPEEACAIAAAGYHHAKQYHTASARARQLLARIDALLRQ